MQVDTTVHRELQRTWRSFSLSSEFLELSHLRFPKSREPAMLQQVDINTVSSQHLLTPLKIIDKSTSTTHHITENCDKRTFLLTLLLGFLIQILHAEILFTFFNGEYTLKLQLLLI
jgi:hypothetical protein